MDRGEQLKPPRCNKTHPSMHACHTLIPRRDGTPQMEAECAQCVIKDATIGGLTTYIDTIIEACIDRHKVLAVMVQEVGIQLRVSQGEVETLRDEVIKIRRNLRVA